MISFMFDLRPQQLHLRLAQMTENAFNRAERFFTIIRKVQAFCAAKNNTLFPLWFAFCHAVSVSPCILTSVLTPLRNALLIFKVAEYNKSGQLTACLFRGLSTATQKRRNRHCNLGQTIGMAQMGCWFLLHKGEKRKKTLCGYGI